MLLGFGAFFCGLLVFLESPFAPLAPPPAEGAGLNPLLRHPSMMIHPPMLYSGYTLFAIPFAFAVGALVTRRLGRRVDPRDAAVHARRLVLPRHRHRARRALVLLRAGLGRLLGLGPGRERVADAVADRHRVPALGDDPGEARDAEGLERLARAGHRRARDPRHVPRALGHPRLDPRLRRLDARRAVPGPDRDDDRAARSRWSPAARESLRSEHRLDSLLSREAVFLLNNLVLVALCFVVFWGTFFPLISEAVTGDQASVGPPWFDRYIVPLALMLVLLLGHRPADRLAARDAPRTCGATSRCPVGAGGASCSSCCSPPA